VTILGGGLAGELPEAPGGREDAAGRGQGPETAGRGDKEGQANGPISWRQGGIS
jgi:hypothetical protein